MRIAVHSDLHTEFGWGYPKGFLEDKSYDVLIIAGDFSNVDVFEQNLAGLMALSPDKPLIFVPGNHDFYAKKTKFFPALCILSSICAEHGVHMLYRDAVTIQGTRFVGCVGWPNLCSEKGYTDALDQQAVKRAISDFSWIKGWSIPRMLEEAEKDYQFIRTMLSIPHPKTVMITHYPPSLMLDSKKHPVSVLTNYFYNDYPEFFDTENKPVAWVYGHTHYGVNRDINGVKCFSNQHGYRGEHTSYSPNFIVEV